MKQPEKNNTSSMAIWICLPLCGAGIGLCFLDQSSFMNAVTAGNASTFTHSALWIGISMCGLALLAWIGIAISSYYLDR